ncbi:hypothetical protein C0585_08420 [Candidatus Woesearchaeota archaeon]|nr:MAG: hypothetical protein C0585_08420 [Candidatus Woesearchaeota archaeon]
METAIIEKGRPHLFSEVQKWGGKGDNLLQLAEMFNVPTGFVISSEAYQEFVDQNNLQGEINDALRTMSSEEASNYISGIFMQSGFSSQAQDTLHQEKEKLNGAVAVRSSSLAEDGAEKSFAGQHESVLGVNTEAELERSVKEVYASLFSARAINYRQAGQNGIDDSIAVVVQEMINPSTSGVAYSATQRDLDEILIESTFGLCTSIVDGRACDIFRVKNGAVESEIHPNKTEQDIYSHSQGRVVTRKINSDWKDIPSMCDWNALQIAKYLKAIEKAYGKPMDIEFALVDPHPADYDDVTYAQELQLYLLQARPITGLKVENAYVLPKIDEGKVIAKSKNTRNQGQFEGPAVVVQGVDHVNKKFSVDGNLRELNERYSSGYVLVTPEVPPELEQFVTNAKAIYSTECGTTGHAAAVACERGIIYMGRGIHHPELLTTLRSGTPIGMATSKQEGFMYLQ